MCKRYCNVSKGRDSDISTRLKSANMLQEELMAASFYELFLDMKLSVHSG